MKKALTLVELMIVVAILGILAAISLPTLQGHTQKAKEAAAKENLRTLRTAIERYTVEHNGFPPGYFNGVFTNWIVTSQLTMYSNSSGNVFGKPDSQYPYGRYIATIPKNPFNSRSSVMILNENDNFPDNPPGTHGWIYRPLTGEIRIDQTGHDSQGMEYYSY